jgi:7-cyano-7-deazaguanine reductase
MTDTSGLTQLGLRGAVPTSPVHAILERVDAPAQDKRYVVRFTCPEFTSLCPLTGQPDFAHMIIDYVPDAWIVGNRGKSVGAAPFFACADSMPWILCIACRRQPSFPR